MLAQLMEPVNVIGSLYIVVLIGTAATLLGQRRTVR
jgi:hypothetical protein